MRNLDKYFITHIAVSCKTDASDWMKRCILSDQLYNMSSGGLTPLQPTLIPSVAGYASWLNGPSNLDRSRGLATRY